MTFTTLLREIQATYREQPRKFHVLATRYYLGAETRDTLELLARDRHISGSYHSMNATLTPEQVAEIVANR